MRTSFQSDLKTVAAIDCGSNTTRLLISRNNQPIVREIRYTRLGKGVDEAGNLDDAAIERVLAAFVEFKQLIDEYEVDAIRAVATSAMRDAGNANKLLQASADIFPNGLEIISGEEEGRLTFAGATSDLEAGNYLVVDIGGGSTEFIFGQNTSGTNAQIDAVTSVQIGAVRLTERCLTNDPYQETDLDRAYATATELIFANQLPASQLSTKRHFSLVGVAGTATTLAAINLGLSDYSPLKTHHHLITREDVEQIFHRLCIPLKMRKQIPGLEPERADVIVAGVIILLTAMRLYDVDQMVVSENDVLVGIVQQLTIGKSDVKTS